MAKTRTTLAAAASAQATNFRVTSATGATVNGFIKVDGEVARIVQIVGTTIHVIMRGMDAGKAADHAANAPVVFFVGTDLSADEATPGFLGQRPPDIVSYGADGAIALPTRDTVALLTKATAGAFTLADPNDSVPDGTVLTVQSATAAAHTVTCTSGFFGTGASSDVGTLAAGIGAGFSVRNVGGKWGLLSAGTASATVVA